MKNEAFENKVKDFVNNIKNNSKFNELVNSSLDVTNNGSNFYKIIFDLFKDKKLNGYCFISITIIEADPNNENSEYNSTLLFELYCGDEIVIHRYIEFNSYDASNTNDTFKEIEKIIVNL